MTLAVAVGGVVALFLALGAAVRAPIAAFDTLSDVGSKVLNIIEDTIVGIVADFEDENWGDLGINIVKGLISGLTAGGPLISGAVTDLAKSAISAGEKALKIGSPSKVFAELGGYTAEGFVQGVDAGSGDAQDAMTAMVSPPKPGSIAGNSGGSGKVTVTIAQIIIQGVQGAEDLVDRLASELEARMMQSGSGVAKTS